MEKITGAFSKDSIKSGFSLAGDGLDKASKFVEDRATTTGEIISKWSMFICIGVGFTVYIFPVIALFIIGIITFFLSRKAIAGFITA
mgnify:CR=1 FL=1